MNISNFDFPFREQFLNTPLAGFLNQHQLMYLAPEAIILIVLLGCILHITFSKNETERQDTWLLAFIGVIIALGCLLLHFAYLYLPGTVESYGWLNRSVFYNMFRADLFSLLVRILLVTGTLFVLMFTRNYMDKRSQVPGEFYVVMLGALLGGMFLSGATDLLMVFVSLETLSISSFILVGYLRGDVLSSEAGLKYLLYGGMATAILLFGFSLLYGITGSTNYETMAPMITAQLHKFPLIAAIMTVMILGGFAFKLSAAPFHMWTPDVYEGAPTPVTAFLAVVSKIAAFAVVLRFFYVLMGDMAGWEGLVSTLAVLSMVMGNVLAVVQKNMKRLLAYSTIAHVGYVLMGLIVMSETSLGSVMYYLMAYLFMNLGAFAVIVWFSNATGGREDIIDFAGLVRKRPFMTVIFSVMLLSLAGIPITSGFFAKFFLFQAVAAAGPQYLWLVILALLTSTVSLYYYLNPIRLMVIADASEAVEALPAEANTGNFWKLSPMPLVLLLCLYGTVVMGVWAQPFMNLSTASIAELSASRNAYHAAQAKPVPAKKAPELSDAALSRH